MSDGAPTPERIAEIREKIRGVEPTTWTEHALRDVLAAYDAMRAVADSVMLAPGAPR